MLACRVHIERDAALCKVRQVTSVCFLSPCSATGPPNDANKLAPRRRPRLLRHVPPTERRFICQISVTRGQRGHARSDLARTAKNGFQTRLTKPKTVLSAEHSDMSLKSKSDDTRVFFCVGAFVGVFVVAYTHDVSSAGDPCQNVA